ncbi:MAG: phosphate propanoyltransferase [Candidatus Paraimprobicoccus trichonymphae]|uniref:Phosphate propanoyltransferase n=1 Tax=Candidatus Paraimprobicoccus trichonymphae TaxID=3033793 RepID=A0AA48L087_9FIRM|nr:MAG: phosphate propanoyltransferase [Candidatus Paraimprobicoccus trichonymphae]
MKILIETSARHVHLSEEVFKVLFGINSKLHIKKYLSQPGQFLSKEKIVIKCFENSIKNVSVLGPFREETQVEISVTDSKKLKINTQIRESGNIKNTVGCEIIGPNGNFTLENGVIISKRHIHMPDDQNSFYNGQIVGVKIFGTERSAILYDTVVRTDKNFKLAMHIDTDEANSVGVFGDKEIYGEIVSL